MTADPDADPAAGPAQADEDTAGTPDDVAAARQELQDLVYSVSHDLREPLRMVRSYVSLIDRRLGDDVDPDIREFMAFAVDGAARMDAMLEGLLAYSRIETHGQPLRPTSVEDAVQAAWARLEADVEAAGATLVTDPLPDVVADPGQLERLFYELLGNAVRFHAKGQRPQIEVGAEDQGEQVKILVKDDGIGIDPEQTERSFAFFQRLQTRTDYPGGVGMGLPIARRIVHRHGGAIGLDARTGKGTTAWVTLPSA